MCVVCCLIEKMSLSRVPFHGLPVIGKSLTVAVAKPCTCCITFIVCFKLLIGFCIVN